ncbi:serine/threonine-protein kinase [Streptomyces sp. NPDC004135]
MVGLGDGRYVLAERLGDGGMGEVRLAKDRHLERTVAIKLLQPRHLGSPDMQSRFLREMKITASLENDNVVRVYDSGWDEKDGQPVLYLVMERLDGMSLEKVIARERAGNGTVPLADVIRWGRHICRALEAAHARGLVHRDLKPGNVQITGSGKAVLLDFGIACFQEDGEGRTQITPAGFIIGTRKYMSPEQSRGERVGAASDLYSLGCLLYEMLTGEPPFTDGDVLWQHQNAEPRRPGSRRDDFSVPWELDSLVMDLLRKSPEARPATAEKVHARLGEVKARIERQEARSARGSTTIAPDPAPHTAPSLPSLPLPSPPAVPTSGTGTPPWAEKLFRTDLPDWWPEPEEESEDEREEPATPDRESGSQTSTSAEEPPDPAPVLTYRDIRVRLAVRYEIAGSALIAGLGTFGLLLGAGGVSPGASAAWGLLVSVALLIVGVSSQSEAFEADEFMSGCLALLWFPALVGGVWLVAAKADFPWYTDITIGFGISIGEFFLGVTAGAAGEVGGVNKGAGAQAALTTLLLTGLGSVLAAVHLDFAWWTTLLTGLGVGVGCIVLLALLYSAAVGE